MRKLYLYAAIATFAIALSASAETACPPGVKSKTAVGPNKKSTIVCMDGKYDTCHRDSQRIGYTAAEATRFCDERKRLGRIK